MPSAQSSPWPTARRRAPCLYRRPYRLLPGGLLIALALGASAHAQTVPGSATGADRELGEKLFGDFCVECHGWTGDGDGKMSDHTYARPRSFALGMFKLSTTQNRVPSDADLTRTIQLGMPGGGMPNWAQLNEEEVAALVRYVRRLGVETLKEALAEEVAKGALTAEEALEIVAERTTPGPRVIVPPATDASEGALERGRAIYIQGCESCHGPQGRPVMGNLKTDFEGNRLLPTSLRAGVFKGGGEPEQLYIRILMGINGTAMPSFESAYSPDEIWDLVHYVRSLAREAESGAEPNAWLEAGDAAASARESEPVDLDAGSAANSEESASGETSLIRILLGLVGAATLGALGLTAFWLLRRRTNSSI